MPWLTRRLQMFEDWTLPITFPVPIAPRSWPIMGPMFSAFDAIRGFASGPNLWLPGHDPAVLQRFPTHSAGIAYLR
jgi:hypothetical protein